MARTTLTWPFSLANSSAVLQSSFVIKGLAPCERSKWIVCSRPFLAAWCNAVPQCDHIGPVRIHICSQLDQHLGHVEQIRPHAGDHQRRLPFLVNPLKACALRAEGANSIDVAVVGLLVQQLLPGVLQPHPNLPKTPKIGGEEDPLKSKSLRNRVSIAATIQPAAARARGGSGGSPRAVATGAPGKTKPEIPAARGGGEGEEADGWLPERGGGELDWGWLPAGQEMGNWDFVRGF
uniref:Uncharacterized protein n=1 Tax=Arundo donax TaxID=35708 RepID=A0A0A9G7N7_ARUDO